MKKKLFSFLLILSLVFSCAFCESSVFSGGADLYEAVQAAVSDLLEARWAKTAGNTVIALTMKDDAYGLAVLAFDPSSAGFSIVVRNDRLLPLTDDSLIALDDHTPEYSVHFERAGYEEMVYLTLGRSAGGVWMIRSLEYTVKTGRPEDPEISVTCRLTEDGQTAVVSSAVDPRIEWPADADFTLAGFSLPAARAMCENALAVLNAAARGETDRKDTPHGYRIIREAVEQDDPPVPEGFDALLNDDHTLLTLSRQGQGIAPREEWTFEWRGAWTLSAVRSLRTGYLACQDGSLSDLESLTEVTENVVWTRQVLKDGKTGEILYTYRDITYPNVLEREDLLLGGFRFDTLPVNAEGYNWGSTYGAYADPELMPALFRRFFPALAYVDGCLMEDGTLEFIARKEDGTLVLLCGANEEKSAWEWVESTPLPEGAKFGYENFSDSVCLNVENGRAAASVRRLDRGFWSLGYVNGLDLCVGPDWVGMYGVDPDELFFGTPAWGDITRIDWTSLPADEYHPDETVKEKAARLSGYVDCTDWATPARSGAGSMTALLAKPGNDGSLQGRFRNGTPLYVLERGAEWTKVRIGHGEGAGVMTGWMRTEDLVFGDETRRADREILLLGDEKQLLHPVEQLIGSRSGQITQLGAGCLLIGEAETDTRCYIVYDLRSGDVGLLRMDSLCDGNG